MPTLTHRTPCLPSPSSLLFSAPSLLLPLSVQSRLLPVLLLAVGLLPLLAAATVSSGSARLLVQKSLDHHTTMPHNFALDSPINVTLTVLNIGDAAASDVVLEDGWLQGFELSGPAGPYKWDQIAAGASETVSYFVTPTQNGGFQSSPARVSYVAVEGAAPQVTHTTDSDRSRTM